ncbi:MAG: hypothetical protein ACRC1M_01100 [Methanobacteriaceae archaeon]
MDIHEIATEKDVKCPKCNGDMKRINSKVPKSGFKCVICGYVID